jgi:hypothetical protein
MAESPVSIVTHFANRQALSVWTVGTDISVARAEMHGLNALRLRCTELGIRLRESDIRHASTEVEGSRVEVQTIYDYTDEDADWADPSVL